MKLWFSGSEHKVSNCRTIAIELDIEVESLVHSKIGARSVDLFIHSNKKKSFFFALHACITS